MPAKKKTQESDSVELVSPMEYAIATLDDSTFVEIIEENLVGEELGISDFQRITVPSGGGLAWNVEIDGKKRPVEEIEGIVIHAQMTRAFWNEGLDEGGVQGPPDCSSADGKIGHGDIGDGRANRPCRECPLNQFGSGKGNSKACKESRQIYLVRPEELLPIVISLPATSIQNWKKYLLRLTTLGRAISSTTTRFGLESAKSKGGIEYSEVAIERGEEIPEEIQERISRYASLIQGLVANSRRVQTAYDSEVVTDA